MSDVRLVSELNFHIGTGVYNFVPEAARKRDLPHLMLLFVALTQPLGRFDTQNYVDLHNLWHCFIPAD